MDRHRPALDLCLSKQVGAGPVTVWIGRWHPVPTGAGAAERPQETLYREIYDDSKAVLALATAFQIFLNSQLKNGLPPVLKAVFI